MPKNYANFIDRYDDENPDLLMGDLVIVRDEEGLDTPHEARGRMARVTGYVSTMEYDVTMLEGNELKFCATRYHLIKLPQVVRLHEPEVQTNELLKLDPDLREHVLAVRDILYKKHEFRFSLTTTLFVMAWFGAQAFEDSEDATKGSGIHEVLK